MEASEYKKEEKTEKAVKEQLWEGFKSDEHHKLGENCLRQSRMKKNDQEDQRSHQCVKKKK